MPAETRSHPTTTDAHPGRGERLAALALIVAGLGVRAASILHHRVNSDEPQHLHVAWAWTQGLLPYRDVFDNHSPLFSLAMSPLLAAAGERADIIHVMRLAMVPFVLGALAAVWVIARRLFSPRVALWSVAIAAVVPDFLRTSVEYRTDQVWMCAWLAALAVLVGGRLSRGRAFSTGAILGIALATSMKTTLLLLGLGVAVAVTAGVATWRGARLPWGSLAGRAALALLGLVVAPAAFALWFAWRGAWADLVYGVAGHNMVAGLGHWGTTPWRPLLLVAAAPVLVLVADALVRGAGAALGRRRALVILAALSTHTILEGCWPLVTRSDLLPLLPLESIAVAALLVALPGAVARRWPGAGAWSRALRAAPALVVAVETVLAATAEPVWVDHTTAQVALVRQVLAVTRPGDTVMDAKGEAIYRRRPYHLALETITLQRFARRLLPDAIPESLVAARTAVVVQRDLDRMPPRARAFITAHYLPFDELRVLGERLEPMDDDGAGGLAFHLDVAQRYAVVTEAGAARGELDGVPCGGPRELARGPHVYRPTPAERTGELAVVWAGAAEHGFVARRRSGTGE
jgi:hypothetical protein